MGEQLWEQEAPLERDRRRDRRNLVLHLEVTAQGLGVWPVRSLTHSNPMPQRAGVQVIADSSGWHSPGTGENPEEVLCQSWGILGKEWDRVNCGQK